MYNKISLAFNKRRRILYDMIQESLAKYRPWLRKALCVSIESYTFRKITLAVPYTNNMIKSIE